MPARLRWPARWPSRRCHVTRWTQAATWCPTCRAQNPILTQLTRDPDFKDLVVFKIDFDTQKDDVRALKATSQSTLIAFKGEAETARSIGDTNPASIATLLKSAL